MENNNLNVISIEELCQILQVCRNTAYRLLKSGELKGFRVGRMWRIPQESVQKYIGSYSKKGNDCDEKRK